MEAGPLPEIWCRQLATRSLQITVQTHTLVYWQRHHARAAAGGATRSICRRIRNTHLEADEGLALLDAAQVAPPALLQNGVTLQADHICREAQKTYRPAAEPPAPAQGKQNRLFRYWVSVTAPALWSPEDPWVPSCTQYLQVLEGRKNWTGKRPAWHPYPEHRCSAWGTHRGRPSSCGGACIHHDNGILGAALLPG